MAVSPFDIINHLSTKAPLEFDIKDYDAWIINKGLINVRDTVFFAEVMNQYPFLDKKMQYDFYYHGIPKAKRFGKWVKVTAINSDVDLIMRHYQVNRKVAESYLKIMTVEDVDLLKQKMNSGGR